MIRKIIKVTIVIVLIALLIFNSGCTPNDPLPETLCTSGIYDNDGIYSEGDIDALGEIWAGDGIGTSGDIRLEGNLNIDSSIRRITGLGTGGYWHEDAISAMVLSPGTSGATLTEANAQSLGGYMLDANNEYLYYAAHIEDDWDGLSDILVEIYFETNEDNAGGNVADTVDIDIYCYNKTPDDGDYIPNINQFNGSTTIGTVERYMLFTQDILIDAPTCNISPMEIIIVRLNFDTVESEINSIIVNYLEIKYQSTSPAMEEN